MKGFEATFGIPAEHRLELVKSRICGGLIRAEYWEHHEFDARGTVVARYESFAEVDPRSGAINSGWCRYDGEGFLTDRFDNLPGASTILRTAAA
jgi:hypothetical protein